MTSPILTSLNSIKIKYLYIDRRGLRKKAIRLVSSHHLLKASVYPKTAGYLHL